MATVETSVSGDSRILRSAALISLGSKQLFAALAMHGLIIGMGISRNCLASVQ
ncbi:MAG: hypothetical protein AAF557_01605 [Pseudomonadota bacterium]